MLHRNRVVNAVLTFLQGHAGSAEEAEGRAVSVGQEGGPDVQQGLPAHGSSSTQQATKDCTGMKQCTHFRLPVLKHRIRTQCKICIVFILCDRLYTDGHATVCLTVCLCTIDVLHVKLCSWHWLHLCVHMQPCGGAQGRSVLSYSLYPRLICWTCIC